MKLTHAEVEKLSEVFERASLTYGNLFKAWIEETKTGEVNTKDLVVWVSRYRHMMNPLNMPQEEDA